MVLYMLDPWSLTQTYTQTVWSEYCTWFSGAKAETRNLLTKGRIVVLSSFPKHFSLTSTENVSERCAVLFLRTFHKKKTTAGLREFDCTYTILLNTRWRTLLTWVTLVMLPQGIGRVVWCTLC